MDFDYEFGGKVYKVIVKEDKNIFKVTIEDEEISSEVLVFNAGFLKFTIGNRTNKCVVSKDHDLVNVFMDGMVYRLKVAKAGPNGATPKTEEEGTLNSPISGKVVKIFVGPGEVVQKGQDLLIIEAMKMEHKVKAPYPGKVKAVNFKVEDRVDIGQLLVEIVRAEEKPAPKAKDDHEPKK
jgi:biotin carboxyl carrier protein